MARPKGRNGIRQELIKQLASEGEKIITTAYNRRKWKNRTYNLHDSYGSAVYANGVLQRSTIRFIGSPLADANRNDKEVGDYKGERTHAQRGSSHAEFGRTGDKRYLTGDTILAYGRDEINKFLNNYKPVTKDGIELVVAAVMYYAKILESGKYQVISSAVTSLNSIANRLGDGVEVYALELNRRANEIGSNSFNVSLGQKIR